MALGQRVRVPFGSRGRMGVVVGVASGDATGLKLVETALDPVPALTAPLLALARWAAEETASAWGEAVARALPPAARVAAPAALPAEAPRRAPGSVIVGSGVGRRRLVEAAIDCALGEGGGVLLLAPEIEGARTWADRLGRRLGEAVPLVTSTESPRRRWETWWACRRGGVRIAVGTRVAAFLPVAPLALTIVVDEEDPAHKAGESPRWHARELAVERARLEGGRCLLTTVAPSLESWVRIQTRDVVAEETTSEGWPSVHRVDLRAGQPQHALSPALRVAARETLAAGRSVLLLLNRLGYGRLLACTECGAVRRCPACRLALAYHRDTRVMACRLCGVRSPARSLCGRCRGRRVVAVGWGTERVEAEARAAFPDVRVVRYDSTVGPERAAAARMGFRTGAARILVGTQMALRCLGEAPVGLGALVLADATLNLPDFRAAERTFQLAWRLADGVGPGGRLWVQSFYPEHPALEAVASGDRDSFYRREWQERQELGYPPARRMARLVAEGRGAAAVGEDAGVRCRAAGLTVLGPVVLPGNRVQVIALGGADLPRLLADALAPYRGRRRLGSVRLTTDVDPVELP